LMGEKLGCEKPSDYTVTAVIDPPENGNLSIIHLTGEIRGRGSSG